MLAVMTVMYALAATSWAISASSLVRATRYPEKYAVLSEHLVGMESRVMYVCQGMNVSARNVYRCTYSIPS